MFRLVIRRGITPQSHHLRATRRALATVSSDQPLFGAVSNPPVEPTTETTAKSGALRPHLGIKVKEDHGLYAFFRKVKDEDSVLGYKYLTYETTNEHVDKAS